MNIEEFKETICEECGDKHSCTDLDGDILDEQAKICMDEQMKCKHEFCIFEDGIIAENEVVTLSCNYLDCDERRDFKITMLELEEIK